MTHFLMARLVSFEVVNLEELKLEIQFEIIKLMTGFLLDLSDGDF